MNWPRIVPRSARTLAWLAWTLCSLIACGGGGDPVVAEDPPGPPALTVPVITVAPQDTTVQEGEPARFSVTATGSSLFYTWRMGGQALGADGPELVLPAATLAQDGATVTVTVLNPAGSVQASARLGVTPIPLAPAITSQPKPLRLLQGEAASLSVVATGTGALSYQWYHDGVAIDGATADTLDLPAARAADAGTYHAVIRNAVGQLASADALVTVALQRPQVAAGSDHTLALKSDGSVWAWGDNSAGQLGDGSTTSSKQPVQVMAAPGTPLAGVVAVAAGANWSLALKSDGSVLAWGSRAGPDGTDPPYPTLVLTGPGGAPLSGVTAISAQSTLALALQQDGKVLAWGATGRLLGNPAADGMFPAPVVDSVGQALTGFVALSAGATHSLAVHGDGTLWAWGSNGQNQLGDGTTVQRDHAAPVLAADGTRLTGIRAAGTTYLASFAVRTDGTLLAWGLNAIVLGNGTFTGSAVPMPVLRIPGKPLPGVQSVSGGMLHSLALDADGCVHSWGDNWLWQLGARSSPLFRNLAGSVDTTEGPALCGAKAIASGLGNISYAIDSTGRLLGWGANDDGRLGDGTTESRMLPVPVLVPGTMF